MMTAREALLAAAKEHRPEVKEMQSVAALRNADLAAARSGRWPELRAGFHYNGAYPYGFSVGEDSDWEWHWTATLTLGWSLWDGGLTGGKADEKELQRRKTAVAYGDLLRSIELEVRRAYLDMRHARQTVEAARGGVGLAERTLRIARSRHEAGLATQLEFADAAVGLSRARLNLAEAIHGHARAVEDLRYASGMLGEEAIEARKER